MNVSTQRVSLDLHPHHRWPRDTCCRCRSLTIRSFNSKVKPYTKLSLSFLFSNFSQVLSSDFSQVLSSDFLSVTTTWMFAIVLRIECGFFAFLKSNLIYPWRSFVQITYYYWEEEWKNWTTTHFELKSPAEVVRRINCFNFACSFHFRRLSSEETSWDKKRNERVFLTWFLRLSVCLSDSLYFRLPLRGCNSGKISFIAYYNRFAK